MPHPFPGDVPGDGGIFTLPSDFIHLVDVNDPPFCLLNVIVGSLNQAEENVLHVVTHVAGLGQGGGVGDGKGDLQDLSQGLGQQGLTAAGGAQEEDVALLELHVLPTAEVDPLIVVVHRHGQGNLGRVLADDVFVQVCLDLFGAGDDLRHIGVGQLLFWRVHVLQDVHAQMDALVADVGPRPGDDLGHLVLVFAAERAADGTLFVVLGQSRFTSLLTQEKGGPTPPFFHGLISAFRSLYR